VWTTHPHWMCGPHIQCGPHIHTVVSSFQLHHHHISRDDDEAVMIFRSTPQRSRVSVTIRPQKVLFFIWTKFGV